MSIAGIYENSQVTIPFVAPTSVISNTPTYGQDSLSLKRYVTRRAKTQRWEISTNLMPTNNDANFLIHNITNNSSKVFDILMPQLNLKDKTTYTGTLVVTQNTDPGVSTVPITFLTGTGILAKGEFVQFSNHDKIYVVTENRIGSGALKIFPELRKSIDNTTVLKYRNNGTVLFKGLYDFDNTFGIQFVDGVLADPGLVTFIEAI